MSDDCRERLIARLQVLPAAHLRYVDAFFTALECGDSSPLSVPLECGDSSPLFPLRRAAATAARAHSPVAGNEKNWPHAPLHRLTENGTYLVTAGTLHKEHYFCGAERLELLESALLRKTKEHGWRLEAWAVFSNHYHFVAHAESGATDISAMLKQLHGSTSRELNRLDGAPGRQVWHNFWDTELTYQKSYLARLNYVHQNPVKHGLVPVANQYRWCSAGWFERTASRAQIRTIYSFKTDRLKVVDDFDPE